MPSPLPASATDRRPPLVLLGGSVRSLAESAARAGFAVHAADLFCDLDTSACACHAVSVAAIGAAGGRYPWSLRTAAAAFPGDAAWCYSGALENHPAVIATIASERPLAGTPANAVRRLRDRRRLAAAGRAAGLHVPLTLASPAGVPWDGSFLVKPRRGAAGRGVRHWTPATHGDHVAAAGEPLLWQRFIPGRPISAAYMIAPEGPRLLGAALQFVGCAWCRAEGFTWCGGVAGRRDTAADPCRRFLAPLERLGAELAARFQPRGAVGVDLVATDDGRLFVLEVNPRPTASMELHERLGAGSIAGLHVAACDAALRGRPTATASGVEPPAPGSAAAWSKAILFAAAPTPITEELSAAILDRRDAWTRADGGWPALSDLPRPGQIIPDRGPVLTVFAPGDTPDDAVALLRTRVATVAPLLPGVPCQPAIRRGIDTLAAGAAKCIR